MNAFTLLGEKSLSFVPQVKLQDPLQRQEWRIPYILDSITPLQYLFYSLSRAAGAFTCIFSPDRAQREGGSGVYGQLIITGELYHESRLGFHLQKSLKSNFELFHSAVGPYHQCHANLKQSITDLIIPNFVFTWIDATYTEFAVIWQKDACSVSHQ